MTMHFAVDRTTLKQMVDIAAKVATTRRIVEIVGMVLITADADKQTVSMQATDFEVTTLTHQPADVQGSGRCVLSHRHLDDIVKTAPAEALCFTMASSNSVSIVSGEAKYRLPTLPPQDFPNTWDLGDRIGPFTDRDLLANIRFAATSTERGKETTGLSGVFLSFLPDGTLRWLGFERTRAAVAIGQPTQVIEPVDLHAVIPNNTVAIVERVFTGPNTRIYVVPQKRKPGPGQQEEEEERAEDASPRTTPASLVVFEDEHTALLSRLIDYPNISLQKAMSMQPAWGFSAPRSRLIAAIRSATAVAEPQMVRRISLSLKEDALTISYRADAASEVQVAVVPSEGVKEASIAINADYLIDALQHLPGEHVLLQQAGRTNEEGEVRFDSSGAVFLYRATEMGEKMSDHYVGIIMPMLVNEHNVR